MRVQVPFRNRQITGFLVSFVAKPEVRAVKTVQTLLDEAPLLDQEMLELTRWIARTYHASWGETLQAALPGPLRRTASGKPRTRKSEAPEAPARTMPLDPTPEQQTALEAVLESVNKQTHAIYLLHGVTGSGKTEVYLQAIQEVLRQGRSSIVLVPEIALTPQTIERFQGRFGAETVAVLHSRRSSSQRLEAWGKIRSGQAQVVIGARSAIFAPVRQLGLVVIDEEHEPSYKQEEAPRYHAREVAIERGRLAQATVLLGSATPSMELYAQATLEPLKPKGSTPVHLLTLPKRIEEIALPKVQVVDMRREHAHGRREQIFSRPLEDALADILQNRQQGILFLNRRGFSTFVHCRHCGTVLKCKACQVALTYHMATRSVVCHYCRASEKAPEMCPGCKSGYVRFSGTGTQRVESEVARIFPQVSAARMDTDVTQSRGSHERILRQFADHKTDVLVGTQMIAKGLDFPRVTLVGVISADTALNLPDFRSAERTFNLLTQVAGRAGRRRLPGKVVVQTYTPHHYAIQAASRHDYAGFFAQEIEIRRQLKLPPFTRLVILTARAARESKARALAETAAQRCRKELPTVEVLGPAPSAIRRLRRSFRWQVVLKAQALEPIQEELADLLRKIHPPSGCYLGVDVDPL